MKKPRAIVVGAGINGVVAAIELRKRGHQVVLVDPGPLPHPLAASTDISKAVRAAYGADEDYTALAEQSREIWRQWNVEFGVELYHEIGFLFMRQRSMQPGDFEYESFKVLERRGHRIERISSKQLLERFPAWNGERYPDGFLDLEAGYAESGRVVATLIRRAKSLGVEFHQTTKFRDLDETGGRVKGILLENGEKIAADTVVMAVGAWTPYALPFTRNFFRASGQPVFHLKPEKPDLFTPERFPIFGADISTTGYYGFPLNRDGVVKIANHGCGREMSPDSPERAVTKEEENKMRQFLSDSFPGLADAPIVFTRICLYCDTHDGNFWIAPDPERPELIIAAGDCGHGFKFAPVLGEIIADAVEGKSNPLLEKFRWRPEVKAGETKEAARFRGNL
ncbi:MAG: sarcosine oxidase [Verrucomicrobia bacterium]|nr:MAG: sarcosine oxidase [Verrucomicrobiota bacterium]PYL91897.1 MAG: sarcosine oxidase [Verrucomicrobiota bacterium]TMP90271.1 MAG: FAD-dependent oxidoreductase [Verrucomicrobiota bacterium]